MCAIILNNFLKIISLFTGDGVVFLVCDSSNDVKIRDGEKLRLQKIVDSNICIRVKDVTK